MIDKKEWDKIKYLTPENMLFATGTSVQLNGELSHYAASLSALLAECGAAVG